MEGVRLSLKAAYIYVDAVLSTQTYVWWLQM